MTSRVALGLLVFLAGATSAAAQSTLALDVSNGRVTLDARDVPVTQILDRWSRLAAITVVNSEKLANVRVTMRFDGVTPRQALDLLLRDAGGYIAATRASRTGVGTELDRLVIVARSDLEPATPPRTAVRTDTHIRPV